MPIEPLANWNGQIMPLREVRVSVLDRGFLFGDAIYELVRVYQTRPFLFSQHIERLKRNLAKLRIPADGDHLAQRARETLAQSGVQQGTIYFQVTRGEAVRMHRFPEPAPLPNELIFVQELGDPYAGVRESGVRALLLPEIRWQRCDIKSTNLLANCLGAEEAFQAGCAEGIYYDPSGKLIEGTRTSLFAVRNGTLLTAPLSGNLLPGITRGLVLKLAARNGIPVSQESLHKDELSTIDELFLSGTTTEILPVVQVDGQVIGSGQPGPVVASLQRAYREEIAAECGPASGAQS